MPVPWNKPTSCRRSADEVKFAAPAETITPAAQATAIAPSLKLLFIIFSSFYFYWKEPVYMLIITELI